MEQILYVPVAFWRPCYSTIIMLWNTGPCVVCSTGRNHFSIQTIPDRIRNNVLCGRLSLCLGHTTVRSSDPSIRLSWNCFHSEIFHLWTEPCQKSFRVNVEAMPMNYRNSEPQGTTSREALSSEQKLDFFFQNQVKFILCLKIVKPRKGGQAEPSFQPVKTWVILNYKLKS